MMHIYIGSSGEAYFYTIFDVLYFDIKLILMFMQTIYPNPFRYIFCIVSIYVDINNMNSHYIISYD